MTAEQREQRLAEQREMLARAIHLETEDGYHVAVVRKAKDPLATRLSCGGKDGLAYCTYRGELLEAIAILRNSLAALMQLAYSGREPEIAPDAGKEFS